MSADGTTWQPLAEGSAAASNLSPASSGAAPASTAKQGNWFARHKILTGVLAVVGVLVLIGIFTGGGDDQTATTTGAAPAEEAPAQEAPAAEAPAEEAPAEEAPAEEAAAAGVGTPVRDGKFEFVVDSVEPNVAEVGDEFLTKTAQGAFTIVNLTVTNIGDQPQTFFDANQKGFDSQGREVAPDTEAGLYANTAGNSGFITDINPGNAITVKVVFDLAPGETLSSIELHDSAFSGGTEVSLT